ncbi:hypothetical protein CBM2589_A10105 [Cupriavidus taiwanensis]|uniref:Uncharacterized protein n=1 Tax=Cupriavidus taiwanensis TaxID=164546 RepID=A0A375BYJ3_9BURK|nr:hypothetical protein CBM2589_A10105 [Cupriavidus taiwanensis]
MLPPRDDFIFLIFLECLACFQHGSCSVNGTLQQDFPLTHVISQFCFLCRYHLKVPVFASVHCIKNTSVYCGVHTRTVG